ncbi:uncharacterized protein LOC133201956 [Saccostrea echinata]|uniref:uncharacterized protein LOC133201956 n=2 Tax=Saccostrea echinata TaxID=191078 RepID=UPI002A7FA296|nr:uncharacterized protein LOC133201956 [Saccostrea echinata]
MKSVNKWIKLYFALGLNYDEILSCLAFKNHIIISKSTLRRKLKQCRLFRRKYYSDILEVALFIISELESSGRQHGYRWMHLKCLQSGYNVTRDTVYLLLQILDSEGVKSRKRRRLKRRQYHSKGPNYVWHMDSYDKLKPYGIAINGCIDGFSRNIVWLEANITNSDPKVIANYYIKAVRRKSGCPQRIRADLGTENTYVEQMQKFLRRDHADELAGDKSFLYGKSTHNQRIEWFWGLLRREMGQYYMDMFSEFSRDDSDLFCGDHLDKSLIQYCFMDLIQRDLDSLQLTWNTHTLQSKQNYGTERQRPILLYTMPELYNAEERLCRVEDNEIDICEEETVYRTILCDETIACLCEMIRRENNLQKPSYADEAKDLYKRLRRLIRFELESMDV